MTKSGKLSFAVGTYSDYSGTLSKEYTRRLYREEHAALDRKAAEYVRTLPKPRDEQRLEDEVKAKMRELYPPTEPEPKKSGMEEYTPLRNPPPWDGRPVPPGNGSGQMLSIEVTGVTIVADSLAGQLRVVGELSLGGTREVVGGYVSEQVLLTARTREDQVRLLYRVLMDSLFERMDRTKHELAQGLLRKLIEDGGFIE